MDLFELEAFVTVVREGGFSKAAKALYRTQPAVSQIIRRLEDELGQPLFDRSSRRGVLTDAGRVLLEHAERLLNFKAQALAAVADVRQMRSGQLVVATNELTCLYVLPLIDAFRKL
jgi:DNA-binding transcriptional LysR family regulator